MRKNITIFCKILIKNELSPDIVKAILPENTTDDNKSQIRIETEFSNNIIIQFKGFKEIGQLQNTLIDLLDHLEFARETWSNFADLKNENEN